MRWFSFGLIASVGLLAGCVGPTAIRTERLDFSEAVAYTGRQQLLLNLVRIHHHESPQFTDVSSITNTSQLNGSFGATFNLPPMVTAPSSSGGSTSPGIHPGHDYSPVFSISSYDQPAITYSPLIGAALVNQIAQPITVDTIAALIDSDWQIDALLTLTIDRLSLVPSDQLFLIDLIADLRTHNLIVFAAVKSPYTNGTLDDTLVMYFDEEQLTRIPENDPHRDIFIREWRAVHNAFEGTYIPPQSVGSFPPLRSSNNPPTPVTRYTVELRTAPTTQPWLLNSDQVIPLLKFRSALGVLMTSDTLEFVKFLQDNEDNRTWWNYDKKQPPPPYIGEDVPLDLEDVHYIRTVTAAPSIPAPVRTSPPTGRANDIEHALSVLEAEASNRIEAVIQSRGFNTSSFLPLVKPTTEASTNLRNRGYHTATQPTMKEVRHFVGIFSSVFPPPASEVYVSVQHDNKFYYILKDDPMSQANFELIGQLLTMQAVAGTTPPPAPTINVGGH